MRVLWLGMFMILTMNPGMGWCNEVCFDGLGCFTDELECHQNFFPPMGPDEIVTSYTLYTRKSKDPKRGEPLETGNTTRLHRSSFRANKKTVVIVHGWGEYSDKDWIQGLKDAILEREKTNVIVLDWAEGADELNYWKSVQNIRVVGRQLAQFLEFMRGESGMATSNLHIIGHSLGAHLAGYAGQYLPGIGRITALDAAGPSFEGMEPACRLDASDALFVDAIHTDTEGGAGITQAVGHRDFYVNGGYSQPGCRWWQFVCDHARANLYFIESLSSKTCGFRGVPCASEDAFANNSCVDCGDSFCPRMGYFSDTNQGSPMGTFYLYTESASPYCAKIRRYGRLHRKWRESKDDRTNRFAGSSKR